MKTIFKVGEVVSMKKWNDECKVSKLLEGAELSDTAVVTKIKKRHHYPPLVTVMDSKGKFVTLCNSWLRKHKKTVSKQKIELWQIHADEFGTLDYSVPTHKETAAKEILDIARANGLPRAIDKCIAAGAMNPKDITTTAQVIDLSNQALRIKRKVTQ